MVSVLYYGEQVFCGVFVCFNKSCWDLACYLSVWTCIFQIWKVHSQSFLGQCSSPFSPLLELPIEEYWQDALNGLRTVIQFLLYTKFPGKGRSKASRSAHPFFATLCLRVCVCPTMLPLFKCSRVAFQAAWGFHMLDHFVLVSIFFLNFFILFLIFLFSVLSFGEVFSDLFSIS